jgi:hypothetical protein
MNAEDCLSRVMAFLEDLVNSVIDRRSQRMLCSWIYPKLAAVKGVLVLLLDCGNWQEQN